MAVQVGTLRTDDPLVELLDLPDAPASPAVGPALASPGVGPALASPGVGLALASPVRRAAAWATDVGVVGLPTLSIAWLVGGSSLLAAIVRLIWVRADPAGGFFRLLPPGRTGHNPDMVHDVIAVSAVLVTAIAVWVAYRVGATAWRGATVGKWTWRICVVREEDPTRPPTLGRAFTRWAVPQAAGLLPFPGTGLVPCLWLLRDHRRQGAHDKAARTLVLRRS